jgi:hypothetical protein
MAHANKRKMKQGGRKRGVSKGMADAIADRQDNPKSAQKFPDKDENVRPAPGTPAKGPAAKRSPGARTKRKTASAKRNAK